MDTREWIFILGVITVVIIALILAARWRRQRFDDIRHGENFGADADDDFASNELPGGGARTVGYRDPTDIERMNDEIRERAEASKPRLSSFRPEPVVQPSLLDDESLDDENDQEDDLYSGQDEESVPLLLDPSDEHNPEGLEEPEQEEESIQSEKVSASNSEHLEELENLADDLKESEPELELKVEQDDQPARLKAGHNPEIKAGLKQEPQRKPAQQVEKQTQQEVEPGEIVIINLMTQPDKPYEGDVLLKLVSELGLRHGEMQIFHYCGRHGDEQPQFRMANLIKPGYFDINNMDNTRTHALCFFFELMPDQDNMKVYESMLSVINKLRDDLGGELHDENRSVFTIQTSEHCRNRIRDYQRRHLLTR